LSKGPNTKDDPSEEDSERRLRRRRKGGSLRVPSDNVPRRGRPDSGEFAPPASDDPRLAVSVAYAFADERSGRAASPSSVHDPIAATPDGREARPDAARTDDGSPEDSGDAAPEVTIDVDVDTPHTERRAHRVARPMGPTGPMGSPESMAGSIESALAAARDRLDDERRADGDSRYDDGENDRTQVRDADDEEESARPDVNAERRDRSAVAGLAPDQNSTLDYPLLEEDYDDEQRRRDRGGEADAAEAGRMGPDRADSVDIPIEEVLDGGSGRIVTEGSGPYAAVRDALLATGGEEGDGSPADALAALDAAGAPAGKRSEARPRRNSRAPTVALSDADIEELDDEEGAPGPVRPSDAGWNMPYLDWPEDEPSSRPSAERAAESQATPGPGAVPIATAPALASEPQERGHDHGSTASAAAPRGGIVRPVTSRDPGDSGEIIDDELIEEIEEAQRAAPMGSAPRPAVPPPLDPNRTLDVDPDADIVSASSAPHAPPPPQVAKQKPPPAPSAARAAAAAAAAAAADPSQARPRRRRGKPWFEDIFDEDYLRTLPFLTPQATQMEAQFVMDALTIPAGSQVLDVGCGYGRHAMELAARGFHVVGLDSSLPLLLRGADEAQRRGLTINFVHGDMRDMAFDAQFDGAYCLFSTFGYFDDETNKKTAQNICRALKPGARCVFEVLNRDYIIAELPLRVWWEGDGCVVLEEVDFNYFSSRLISNRSVVFDDGRQLEQEISIRSFGLHELGKLLHSAGFRVVEVSGNMITKGRFFGAQSRDIVVIAERRVEKPGSPDAGGRIP
jgi:SAM-dependent methyltransferase